MQKSKGIIDGIPIEVYIPETLTEFKEGIRLLGGQLDYGSSCLFNFEQPQQLSFENSGVNQDITVLFFHSLLDSNIGVVSEIKKMNSNDWTPVYSYNPVSVALELSTEFCIKNKITEGSILTLTESEGE